MLVEARPEIQLREPLHSVQLGDEVLRMRPRKPIPDGDLVQCTVVDRDERSDLNGFPFVIESLRDQDYRSGVRRVRLAD